MQPGVTATRLAALVAAIIGAMSGVAKLHSDWLAEDRINRGAYGCGVMDEVVFIGAQVQF